MRKRSFVVGMECKRLLEDSVQKRLLVSITGKSDQNCLTSKAQLLALHGNRLVMTLPDVGPDASYLAPEPAREIAIAFKKGYNKCIFTTRIIAHQQFELEPGVNVPALTVYRPEQIEKIKRRAYNRTEPPAGEDIIVTFWPCDEPKRKFQARLANFSAGGVGLTTAPDALPGLEENRQCYMCFVPLPHQEPVQFQVRYRHASQAVDGENYLLGFQIIGLELSEEGRSTLRRIGRIVQVYERQQPISCHSNL